MRKGEATITHVGTRRQGPAVGEMPATISVPEAQPYTLRDVYFAPDILGNMGRRSVVRMLNGALLSLAKHEGWDKPKSTRKPVSK